MLSDKWLSRYGLLENGNRNVYDRDDYNSSLYSVQSEYLQRSTIFLFLNPSYILYCLAILTLNSPNTTEVVYFSCLLKCLRSLYGKQCEPRSDHSIGAVCSESTLFASILNSSVMLGNYLQQMTSADDIFRCFSSWRFKG